MNFQKCLKIVKRRTTISMISRKISQYNEIFFFKWAIPGLFFFIFVFSLQLTVQCKFLPMTRFELRTYGIGSNRSTNWATTTAQQNIFALLFSSLKEPT